MNAIEGNDKNIDESDFEDISQRVVRYLTEDTTFFHKKLKDPLIKNVFSYLQSTWCN